MAVNLDLNKICRTCLTDTVPLKDLFSVCSPEIFKYCTSVEVIRFIMYTNFNRYIQFRLCQKSITFSSGTI